MQEQSNDLLIFLETQGYLFLRYIEGRGYCGIEKMLFTWGLCYGLDWDGREGRYCYKYFAPCLTALAEWDGVEEPPGDWIVHKGRAGRWDNPENVNDLKNL